MTYPPHGHAGHGSYPSGPGPGPDERLDFTTGYDLHSLPLPDPETLEGRWDLEGDLARLLQSSAEEPSGPADPLRRPDPLRGDPLLADPLRDDPHVDDLPYTGETLRPEARVAQHAAVRGRGRRRRVRFRMPTMPWLQLASLVFAAVTALIVAMLSVLSGMVSYGPLRFLAAPTTSGSLADWWPLLVYGPWLVASLSVLRAALHHRGAAHSWMVVVLFSAIAVLLCVAHAPKTLAGIAVAGLPPVAALISFHQLVRQITLNDPPRHALPRQRGTQPRG
ncbi:DUF2637 domain-containing protein [Streptomyces pactum]|uniref:DUF2637 domain-containing protein n=1 Tax=Streptomyces pactum TaxID=68249 RepID=A0ABS0NS07_9ACTN|nr:DUF2637 domain-containing protein [Streptomyces pactum]MBH5337991.1 DUF2637 domain-containing protein [Streptomyces pactum]